MDFVVAAPGFTHKLWAIVKKNFFVPLGEICRIVQKAIFTLVVDDPSGRNHKIHAITPWNPYNISSSVLGIGANRPSTSLMIIT